MRALCLVGLASILVAGCNLQQLLDPTADAGAAPADAATTSDGSAAANGPQGANCVDVGGGSTLCQYISSCPDNSLSTSLFPHCGFRISGSNIDMECWCTDAICPVGVATSCDQIASIVGDQDEDTVCQKEVTGGCTSLTGAGTEAGAPVTGNVSCNPTCTAGCGNTPACQQACGC